MTEYTKNILARQGSFKIYTNITGVLGVEVTS